MDHSQCKALFCLQCSFSFFPFFCFLFFVFLFFVFCFLFFCFFVFCFFFGFLVFWFFVFCFFFWFFGFLVFIFVFCYFCFSFYVFFFFWKLKQLWFAIQLILLFYRSYCRGSAHKALNKAGTSCYQLEYHSYVAGNNRRRRAQCDHRFPWKHGQAFVWSWCIIQYFLIFFMRRIRGFYLFTYFQHAL